MPYDQNFPLLPNIYWQNMNIYLCLVQVFTQKQHINTLLSAVWDTLILWKQIDYIISDINTIQNLSKNHVTSNEKGIKMQNFYMQFSSNCKCLN